MDQLLFRDLPCFPCYIHLCYSLMLDSYVSKGRFLRMTILVNSIWLNPSAFILHLSVCILLMYLVRLFAAKMKLFTTLIRHTSGTNSIINIMK